MSKTTAILIWIAICLTLAVFIVIGSYDNKATAEPEYPYAMQYYQTKIGGVARYENSEVVCYTFDQSQKGGISCLSKLGTNLH